MQFPNSAGPVLGAPSLKKPGATSTRALGHGPAMLVETSASASVQAPHIFGLRNRSGQSGVSYVFLGQVEEPPLQVHLLWSSWRAWNPAAESLPERSAMFRRRDDRISLE